MTGYIQKNLDFYDSHADSLAEYYMSVTTEKSLPVLCRIFEKYQGDSRKLLEMGCGAGADADWISRQNWDVDATDGSPAFIEKAKDLFRETNVNFFVSKAPDFIEVEKRNRKYDVILMAAFIFHFEEAERDKILKKAASLLSDQGLIHLTLRQGPTPEGRTMFPVMAETIEAFASQNRLQFKDHGIKPDALGRSDVSWNHVSIWRGPHWNHAQHEEFRI